MTNSSETVDDAPAEAERVAAVPAAVVVIESHAPALRAAVLSSDPCVIGRAGEGLALADEKTSRRHVELRFVDGQWRVRDLGSRNGTFVDGVRIEHEWTGSHRAVLRIGGTLIVLVRDARAYLGATVSAREHVCGPVLRAAIGRIEAAAKMGKGVLLIGESGAGKELAARAFHRASLRSRGPFVAVNGAAIPESIAERLLFGARKGAFSGASADAQGLIESAHGGTLFLDELGELDASVQAKLLRAIETREVLALGATRPQRVDVQWCCATHRDLRESVARGTFRADLYFRLAQPEVRLPPLRERPEELGVLIDREVRSIDPVLSADARLVEQCLLRPWPGNVRELLAAVRDAAHRARAERCAIVRETHLSESAGRPLASVAPEERAPRAEPTSDGPSRSQIERALFESEGNVAAAARALGVHRTQLYRWIERYKLARG